MDVLKIKDKEHPFWFAIKARREMQLCENLSEKDDIYFIWLGLKYGSLKAGETFPYSEDQLLDIFEEDLECFEKACAMLGVHMGKLKKLRGTALEALS